MENSTETILGNEHFPPENLPGKANRLFFLRLTGFLGNQYYPTAGDLVLQLVLPKFDPTSNDLTAMGSVPVVVIFSNQGECISLPLWESEKPPNNAPYVELDRDLEYVGAEPQERALPTRVPGNHLYALLMPVYASSQRGIQWLLPKYKDLPVGPWLWRSEPFCQFSISPTKLGWYQWRVYHLLFPTLSPVENLPFSTESDTHQRNKFGWKEQENVRKVMDLVWQLQSFWSAMAESSWTEEHIKLLGENVGKRINPPIRSFEGWGYLEIVPDWRDLVLLPLPSATPGTVVADSDREELERVTDEFRWCIELHDVVVDPEELRESEKYLLRVPPQDEIPVRNPAVSRSRYYITANGLAILRGTRESRGCMY
jgi:hypothetical protein